MKVTYSTDKECVLFEAEPDCDVSYYQNSLKTNIYLGRVHICVETKPGPVPDLTGYKPFERHGLKGYCKSQENKEFAHYEEIDPIGEHEQKILLIITILDYTTKESRTKTLDEIFCSMPVVRFLASIKTISRE